MGRTACTEPQCLYEGALYLYLLLVPRHKLSLYGSYFALGREHGCAVALH